MKVRVLSIVAALAACTPLAGAWSAYGHRLVTRLAMESAARRAGAEWPAWLRDEKHVAMIADQSVTPDRWRSTRTAQLKHINEPDHFLDIEDLAPFGLELRTISPLRHEYAKQLAVARLAPGFAGPPVNPVTDPEHVREYPGFLPHATMETWGKVVSSMKTLRTLEQLDDPQRSAQVEMARASVLYNMGVLAHYVGDAAQPLHTTKHFNGWVGDNPKGYTTDRGFHAYIDGGAIKLHAITLDDVRLALRSDHKASATNPWEDVLTHIERSFRLVEPLYELKKSGDLDREPGRRFLCERLADGGGMLGALYAAAWEQSGVSKKDVEEFLKYDGPLDVTAK